MIAQPLDLRAELDEAALQHRRRVAVGAVENRTDVAELETRLPVEADLSQTFQVLLAVQPVVSRAAADWLEQPDRFVIEHGGAAQTAGPRQTGHRQRHRSTSSLNPMVLDRSSVYCTDFRKMRMCCRGSSSETRSNRKPSG